jgi:hypothetical protein
MCARRLVDENVHFRHTVRLVNALIAHQKPHEVGVVAITRVA